MRLIKKSDLESNKPDNVSVLKPTAGCLGNFMLEGVGGGIEAEVIGCNVSSCYNLTADTMMKTMVLSLVSGDTLCLN